MTLNRCQTLAVALLILAPAARLLGQESPPVAAAPAEAGAARAEGSGANSQQNQSQEPLYQVSNSVEEFAARFGWWALHNSGAKVKTGEWQGLDTSSPFWDADGLLSDGNRTFNFQATGVESEATQAGLRYYAGPGLTVDAGYNRFIHRLDHKPPLGFNDGPFGTLAPAIPAFPTTNPGNATQFAQDLNMGQDYAIRVQEMKANFKGELTDNLKWRLNVWGLKKQGERQATALGHCYTLTSSTVLAQGVNQVAGQPGGGRCHLLSQEQRIDWMTTEIEPVLEARVTDWLTFEYSRPMRSFGQSDEMVFRTYNGGGALPGVGANTLAPYAVVPESTTDIDRMKLAAKLGDDTDAYVLGYVGNNFNRFRDTDRHFSGVDGRVSNHSIDGLQVTGYGKTYQTNTTAPAQSLNAKFGSNIWGEPTLDNIDEQINRQFNSVGATGRWRPFWDERGTTLRSGMSLIGGYEYSTIIRQNSSHEFSFLDPNAVPPITAASMVDVTHDQPDSNTHKFFVGSIHDWTRCFKTNWKYTFIDTHFPLFGSTSGEKNVAQQDFATPAVDGLNSNLPTHVDRVEVGGTWQPVDNFMLTGTFYLEKSDHRSDFARFSQDSYPWVLSAWYAPSCKLSLNGGYAQFSSFIDQDITVGSQGRFGSFPGPHAGEWEEGPAFTAPWRFAGRSDVLNLGAVYAFTQRLSLNGGFEYVHGLNRVATPPSPTNDAFPGGRGSFTPAPYTDISQASRVDVNTYRMSLGVDYWLRDGISTYFRYNFYDYLDQTAAFNTGETHMFLTGLTATF